MTFVQKYVKILTMLNNNININNISFRRRRIPQFCILQFDFFIHKPALCRFVNYAKQTQFSPFLAQKPPLGEKTNPIKPNLNPNLSRRSGAHRLPSIKYRASSIQHRTSCMACPELACGELSRTVEGSIEPHIYL